MVSFTHPLPHACELLSTLSKILSDVHLVRTQFVTSVTNKSVVHSAPFSTFYYPIIRSTESYISPQSQSIKCEKSVKSAPPEACFPFTYETKRD